MPELLFLQNETLLSGLIETSAETVEQYLPVGIEYVAEGKVLAYGGALFDGHRWVVFGDFGTELRRQPVFGFKVILDTLNCFREAGMEAVYAAPDLRIPGAERLLQRLGFVKTGRLDPLTPEFEEYVLWLSERSLA